MALMETSPLHLAGSGTGGPAPLYPMSRVDSLGAVGCSSVVLTAALSWRGQLACLSPASPRHLSAAGLCFAQPEGLIGSNREERK